MLWLKNTAAPPRPTLSFIMATFAGSFLTILVLGYLSQHLKQLWIMAPFGASCVLLFALPESPLAQPRHVIGGHFCTTLVGLLVLSTIGQGIIAAALAVALGIIVMQLLRITHPPAGANPLVVLMLAPSWHFLLFPVLSGALVMVFMAWLSHRYLSHKPYPVYW